MSFMVNIVVTPEARRQLDSLLGSDGKSYSEVIMELVLQKDNRALLLKTRTLALKAAMRVIIAARAYRQDNHHKSCACPYCLEVDRSIKLFDEANSIH